MAGNRQINYIKPSEPSFLAKFKKEVGYVEGPTVDTKKEEVAVDTLDDRADNDDEKPVVVVMKKGDLTEEEVEQAQNEIKEKDEQRAPADNDEGGDGRIVFRKPTKRSQADASSDLNVTSSKKKKDKEKKQKGSSSKRVQNASLLSFGDEEEDT